MFKVNDRVRKFGEEDIVADIISMDNKCYQVKFHHRPIVEPYPIKEMTLYYRLDKQFMLKKQFDDEMSEIIKG